MTCVGSIEEATIRFASPGPGGDNMVVSLKERHEIVSLVGTIEAGRTHHLHISLADQNGVVIGGHVSGPLRIFTTAELVLGQACDLKFSREPCELSGYPELAIKSQP
jgi:predicted DNA-binding protein with PD1-like motif